MTLDNFFQISDHFGVPAAVMAALGVAVWLVLRTVWKFSAPYLARAFDAHIELVTTLKDNDTKHVAAVQTASDQLKDVHQDVLAIKHKILGDCL